MSRLLIFLMLLLALACNHGSKSDPEVAKKCYQLIDVESFSETVDKLEGVTIVDVRTEEEFRSGHLSGAVNLDFNKKDFDKKITQFSIDEKPILVYCQSGGRSNKACQLMLSKGYCDIIEMKGGIQAWNAKSLPLEK